jgi:hypothetical protein
MKNQSWWGLLNIGGRIFGIWCGIWSLISIAWGIGANTYFGIETTAEIKSNQTIYLGTGIFFLIASIGLCLAKPYRPDIEHNDDVKGNWRGKLRWWTGDPL